MSETASRIWTDILHFKRTYSFFRRPPDHRSLQKTLIVLRTHCQKRDLHMPILPYFRTACFRNRKKEYRITVFLTGRDDGIRTHDLFVPNEARYQTALHPDCIDYYTTVLWKMLQEFSKELQCCTDLSFLPSTVLQVSLETAYRKSRKALRLPASAVSVRTSYLIP